MILELLFLSKRSKAAIEDGTGTTVISRGQLHFLTDRTYIISDSDEGEEGRRDGWL